MVPTWEDIVNQGLKVCLTSAFVYEDDEEVEDRKQQLLNWKGHLDQKHRHFSLPLHALFVMPPPPWHIICVILSEQEKKKVPKQNDQRSQILFRTSLRWKISAASWVVQHRVAYDRLIAKVHRHANLEIPSFKAVH